MRVAPTEESGHCYVMSSDGRVTAPSKGWIESFRWPEQPAITSVEGDTGHSASELAKPRNTCPAESQLSCHLVARSHGTAFDNLPMKCYTTSQYFFGTKFILLRFPSDSLGIVQFRDVEQIGLDIATSAQTVVETATSK